MTPERPDLTGLNPDLVAYIEALEAEIEQLGSKRAVRQRDTAPPEPDEPPTTINIITISAGGLAKRTPRHLYSRQRRGGMGVFDLDSPEEDPPTFLVAADESDAILLITDRGRVFRLGVSTLPESPIHSRGESILASLGLPADERLSVVLPAQGETYLVLITERGQVRRYPSHNFSANMRPGAVLYDINQGGAPAAACWSAGDGDLFIATRTGVAIRFTENQVPVRGCLGIRLERDDAVVGITAVGEESGVFLLGADGKGTIRTMDGFRANKSPGSGGKVALKTDQLICAHTVADDDDIFIISQLGKIIRFRAAEIPAKSGVVQGVNCMDLRADEIRAAVWSR